MSDSVSIELTFSLVDIAQKKNLPYTCEILRLKRKHAVHD
jgi:hypothetical protein